MGLSSVSCTVLAKVTVIGGPTASGKSSVACQLAQDRNGIILNGDSLQVYAGMEVITDQPSYQTQKDIPHRLYGFLDPTHTYSAGLWLSDVQREIEQSHQQGLLPIVVGGTGFYLKALLEGVSPIPPIDPQVRQDLLMGDASQEELYGELQRVDPVFAKRIHPHDRQRTMRGLEVYEGTGKALSLWQEQKPTPPAYEFETILLMPPKEDLHAKIETRVNAMLAKGVLEEVESLLPQPLSPTALKAIGLREFGAYLEGGCSLEEAKELTVLHTCQYAKRQRTWFRHQKW